LEHAAEGSSFPLVDAFIGLSGVYCVKTHYLFEKSRGVHLISPMGAAADGIPSAASPTLLIEHGGLLNFPATLLLHGSDDVTVPVTSSADFANALRRCGIRVQTAFPNGGGHADPLMDMMSKAPRASATGQGIEQFWEGTKTPRSKL
jgi:acetyl esterase/lipase